MSLTTLRLGELEIPGSVPVKTYPHQRNFRGRCIEGAKNPSLSEVDSEQRSTGNNRLCTSSLCECFQPYFRTSWRKIMCHLSRIIPPFPFWCANAPEYCRGFGPGSVHAHSRITNAHAKEESLYRYEHGVEKSVGLENVPREKVAEVIHSLASKS